MNHIKLVKRAWTITWRYKVLWIFGILLALTGSGGSSGGGGGSSNGSSSAAPIFSGLPEINPGLVAALITLCCCTLLILIIALTIIRYVARTALYRSVDQIEVTGASPSWREGFRLGWSNRAFRLWLLDLVIGIPFVIVAIVLLILGATPLLLLLIDNPVARGLGIAGTIGLELLIIALLFVAVLVLLALGQFWAREIAIADRSLGDAIVAGFRLVRGRLKDVGLMWLLMAVIGLGFGFVLVPIAFAAIMFAFAVGGGLGFALYRLTDSVFWALLFGIPPFFLITVVPLTFITGIYLVFESSSWTLTYREVAGRVEATPADAEIPPTATAG